MEAHRHLLAEPRELDSADLFLGYQQTQGGSDNFAGRAVEATHDPLVDDALQLRRQGDVHARQDSAMAKNDKPCYRGPNRLVEARCYREPSRRSMRPSTSKGRAGMAETPPNPRVAYSVPVMFFRFTAKRARPRL